MTDWMLDIVVFLGGDFPVFMEMVEFSIHKQYRMLDLIPCLITVSIF